MKNLYLTAVLIGTTCLTAHSQQTTYAMETVGNPSTSTAIASYAGWTNNGILTFSGNAEVQNLSPSNNLSASGGGNVFFNNVVGTNFEIRGFNPSSTPTGLDITFDMYGYDPANLNQLVLEYSTDGVTYTPVAYRRMFRNYMPPTPWDIMVSDPLPGTLNFSALRLRFRQTTATQQFRIDDIQASFYYVLPIKLTSFSGKQVKDQNNLQWQANSTEDKEHFLVEKSTDGRNFTTLANIPVKGIGDFSYSFNDNATGKTFYRLKLVDATGKFNYSQIVFLDAKAGSELVQKIYPVPARQVLNTQLHSSKDAKATVILTDMSGRVVVNNTYSLMQGMNNCAIDVQRLKAGMYILKIVTGDLTETRPVMVQ